MAKLDGKVALVTGGASGLGEACVRRFTKQGMKAIILDRDVERGKALAKEIGKSVRFAQADVTSEDEVEAAVDLAQNEFGGLNVAVSCAGVAWAADCGFAWQSLEVGSGCRTLPR